ncbi:hypothetical protein AHAS_Ahas04G0085800 [Arachis hypogaea]
MRVFTHHSKEKQVPNDSENKSSKDKKKKGLGKLRHGETNSFIPLFREPSSIERIFGDFEREQQLLSVRPPTPLEQPKPAPVVPPRAASPRAPSPRDPSPRAASFSPFESGITSTSSPASGGKGEFNKGRKGDKVANGKANASKSPSDPGIDQSWYIDGQEWEGIDS